MTKCQFKDCLSRVERQNSVSLSVLKSSTVFISANWSLTTMDESSASRNTSDISDHLNPLPDLRQVVDGGDLSADNDEESGDTGGTSRSAVESHFEEEGNLKPNQRRRGVALADCPSDKRKSAKETSKTRKKRKKAPNKTAYGYVCDQCQPNRYFKKSQILYEHKKVIHGVKPLPCLWCGKQFFNNNQLLVHQTLYAHDKPLD